MADDCLHGHDSQNVRRDETQRIRWEGGRTVRTHSSEFTMSKEGWQCGGFTNEQANPLLAERLLTELLDKQP